MGGASYILPDDGEKAKGISIYFGTQYQHKLLCRLSVTEAAPKRFLIFYHKWGHFSMSFAQKSENAPKKLQTVNLQNGGVR